MPHPLNNERKYNMQQPLHIYVLFIYKKKKKTGKKQKKKKTIKRTKTVYNVKFIISSPSPLTN